MLWILLQSDLLSLYCTSVLHYVELVILLTPSSLLLSLSHVLVLLLLFLVVQGVPQLSHCQYIIVVPLSLCDV